MPDKKKNATQLQSYTFQTRALAAHFRFTNGSGEDFGPEYALAFHGRAPFKHKEKTGDHRHPEISFTHSWVHIAAKQERAGVYTAVAKTGLKNLNVKGKLMADEIEAGMMAVYREEWYGGPASRKHPRILPLPPVIKNLRICGQPYQLGKQLLLPEPFELSDEQRKQYFLGQGPEIEPLAISEAPGKRLSSACGEIEVSADTRRIRIPDFGIVTFAEWKWLPPNAHRAAHTVQWMQLVSLELSNPGSGGGGGLSIGGKAGP